MILRAGLLNRFRSHGVSSPIFQIIDLYLNGSEMKLVVDVLVS